MSRVIAIANQKGGVGKTTTAVNLAAGLAEMRTRSRVILIDIDPQGNATTSCGIDKNGVESGSFEVLMGQTMVGDAILFSETAHFHLLAANGDLTGAEVLLLEQDNAPFRLQEALASIRNNFDFVIIDCPPTLNMLTVNALTAADSVLIPVQCEYYALEGLSSIMDTIEQVKQGTNPALELEGVLRTMYDARNRLAEEVSAQLQQHFSAHLFTTIIPRNVRLAEAPSYGLSVLAYDNDSRGAEAYRALAQEIARRNRNRK